jgi:hypothetical protein
MSDLNGVRIKSVPIKKINNQIRGIKGHKYYQSNKANFIHGVLVYYRLS